MSVPLVAIVGRPNVGKSTLFNRLVGGRPALVANEAGLTRDRSYGNVSCDGRTFTVIDTGGFDTEAAKSTIGAQVKQQALLAIAEADVTVVVLDARQGLTAADQELVAVLRKNVADRELVFAVNKVDGPAQEATIHEFYRVGAKELRPICAEHGLGVDELIDALLARLPANDEVSANEMDGIRLALIGRPNAGKSALLNRIAGTARAIVSDLPGTTRDPIDIAFEHRNQRFHIVDTAGIRRKQRRGPTMEQIAVIRALRAANEAEVCCLVMDAAEELTGQDSRLARMVLDAGRGLVLVLNKSDLLRGATRDRRQVKDDLADHLGFARFAPQVFLSAKTGTGVDGLFREVRRVHQQWTRRITTAELNRFLADVTRAHSPPLSGGREVKIYYITQPKAAPPSFVAMTNRPKGITLPYQRYLANQLRAAFGFSGVPLQLMFRRRKGNDASRARRSRAKNS